MKDLETRNPFGATTRLDLRRAKVVDKTEEPKTDFVGVFLGAVPSLEKAREALEKVSETLQGSSVCDKCSEWCESIRQLEVDIMECAIGAVRGDIGAEPAAEVPEVPEETSITPGMIAGREDIPKSLLSR